VSFRAASTYGREPGGFLLKSFAPKLAMVDPLTGMADVIAGKVNADVLTGLIIRTSLPDLTAHYCSNPGSTAQSSWEGKFALHGQIRCGADARH
jgi:hypothetical protein